MRRYSWVVLLFILVGGGFFIWHRFSSKVADAPHGVEEIDFEFNLRDFEGNSHKLSDFRSKPVFVDFWAAWCPFCTNEMPEIQKIHEEFGDKLVVIGIHRTDTEDLQTGKNFADDLGITYLLLSDPDDSYYRKVAGGGNFMPMAVYFDSQGNLVKKKAGPKSAAEMRNAVEELLNE